MQIIGADPEGSVYSGGTGRPYLTEGVGEDFWPTTYDPSLVDRVVMVTDAESFAAARRVTREEGLLIGGSCGTAVHAALVVGEELGPDDVVVVLLPDSGRNYLSKIFDDEWMTSFGFLRSPDLDEGGATAGDVLAAKDDSIPDLVVITDDVSARDAFARMRELGVSQLIVSVSTEPPLAAKEISGMVSELPLMDKAFVDAAALDRPVATSWSRRHRWWEWARRCPTWSTGSSTARRCWCSTAVIPSASSPAPTCSPSSRPARRPS